MTDLAFDPTTKLGYLETTGRQSGLPRETEIWFAYENNQICLLSGGGTEKDWVRNAIQHPEVRFRIGTTWLSGTLSLVTDETLEARIRRIVAGKYYDFDPDGPDPLPNDWSRTAVPIVIALE